LFAALPVMNIRQASAEDASELSRIAHEAKQHWGYPENWMQRWDADLTITPEFIGSNYVYVAEDDKRVAGFYALAVKDQKAELEHMWVAPDLIGTGVGKQLFLAAMQKAAELKLSAVEISSDPNAEGFYRKMGAFRVGETVSEVEGEPRILPRLIIQPENSSKD
jgi:N-acetylglutamate synthase-like GNAT family acetyltransferase